MHSPLAALGWEIWRRGRRAAWLALGCVCFCAVVNLATPENLRATETAQSVFEPLFGMLMVLSMFLIMGIFNYTEYNSTREWNGFPYRLFALPVPTWKLVTLPMILGVVAVELVYLAWIKLVWTHETVPRPEWLAVVLGAYMACYQAMLWSLAGFRIVRLLVLGVGGVSIIVVGLLPFMGGVAPTLQFSERSLILVMIVVVLAAHGLAWTAVARQRCGGGRRQSWVKILRERLSDALPRRTRDFASPAAAQFWFEWRRAGLLLPLCVGLVLVAIFGPCTWLFRHDPQYTLSTLVRLLAMPLVLAFVIGKVFVKPELWSADFSLPPFLAVRPLPAGDFVIGKLKVAALSVTLAWLLVLAFAALWLPLWADTTQLRNLLNEFRLLNPQSWPVIIILFLAVLMVLTWRCLVSGLWIGLSGSRFYYAVSSCLQVVVPAGLLLAAGLCSETIDAGIRDHPNQMHQTVLTVIGWLLALGVIVKFSFAVFSWGKITPRRTGQYLLIWTGATLGFVALAILVCPVADPWRLEHLFVLGALVLFPFARLGVAPRSLAKNRHR
jgi:hypothetical protein